MLFTYGSEKEEWVKAVSQDFNQQENRKSTLFLGSIALS